MIWKGVRKMRPQALAIFPILLLIFLASTGVLLAHGGSGGGSGSGSGGDDRVRVEVRTGEDEPEENRVRVEIRGEGASVEEALDLVNQLDIPEDVNRIRVEARDDGDRVRIELRGPEVEEEAIPNIEIEGNTFEITGEVTVFTGGTVTVAGQVITINPGAVANFEQEGTIEVGEVIKVEGIISDGTFLTREIKANGVEVEVEDEVGAAVLGNSLTSLLAQILAFFRSLT